SAALRIAYVGNSLYSLRRSLRLDLNARILGRICRMFRSKMKNTLRNSLLQGIDGRSPEIDLFGFCGRPATFPRPLLRTLAPDRCLSTRDAYGLLRQLRLERLARIELNAARRCVGCLSACREE